MNRKIKGKNSKIFYTWKVNKTFYNFFSSFTPDTLSASALLTFSVLPLSISQRSHSQVTRPQPSHLHQSHTVAHPPTDPNRHHRHYQPHHVSTNPSSLLSCTALDLTTILSFWWLPDLASVGLRFSEYVLSFLGFQSEFVEVFLGWWWLFFGWFFQSFFFFFFWFFRSGFLVDGGCHLSGQWWFIGWWQFFEWLVVFWWLFFLPMWSFGGWVVVVCASVFLCWRSIHTTQVCAPVFFVEGLCTLHRFVHQFLFGEGLCTSWVLRSMKRKIFYSETYNWKIIFTIFSCLQSNTVKWKYFTFANILLRNTRSVKFHILSF